MYTLKSNYIPVRQNRLILRPVLAIVFLFVMLAGCGAETQPQATSEPVSGRQLIKSGSKWEELAAYSRAVVVGDWIFVSGTVGFNPKDSSISPDFDVQMDQIFKNISWALAQADAELADIVSVRCFLVDPAYVEAMSRKLHQYLGSVQPTNATVIVKLAAEGALIELEVIAHRRTAE